LGRATASARALFLERYDRLEDIPWIEMAHPEIAGNLGCDAGRRQIALGTDGRLWGCFLFPHFFAGRRGEARGTEYCYGDVDGFLADPEGAEARVLTAVARLGMRNARTPASLCETCGEIKKCWICPLAAAFDSGRLGLISVQTCLVARRLRREKERLKMAFAARGLRS